jgi:Lrp/AsnC family transcriptional regulator, leucine-responsive regulatory protein
MTLDDLDRKILRLLIADSQISLSELGASVGLSTTALHHRIRKLKMNKVIGKFTIALSEEFYASQVSCFVRVIKFKKSSIDLAHKLKALSGVESCYSVTGEESLMLKVRAQSTQDLQKTLELINRIDGVERTLTSLIIEEHFNKGATVL